MSVVLADDSVLLREGLVRLLREADCEVVASVGDAPSLLSAVAEHRPDVAVVDVRMPPTMTDDGLRAAVAARAAQPDLGVLMLSAYIEMSYADVLLSDGRGRVGYLLKDRVTSLDRHPTRCGRSPLAARSSILRSSPSCSSHVARTRSGRSRRESERCCP